MWKDLLDGTTGICDRHHHDDKQDETEPEWSERGQSVLFYTRQLEFFEKLVEEDIPAASMRTAIVKLAVANASIKRLQLARIDIIDVGESLPLSSACSLTE
jgi:hypothetical protein